MLNDRIIVFIGNCGEKMSLKRRKLQFLALGLLLAFSLTAATYDPVPALSFQSEGEEHEEGEDEAHGDESSGDSHGHGKPASPLAGAMPIIGGIIGDTLHANESGNNHHRQ